MKLTEGQRLASALGYAREQVMRNPTEDNYKKDAEAFIAVKEAIDGRYGYVMLEVSIPVRTNECHFLDGHFRRCNFPYKNRCVSDKRTRCVMNSDVPDYCPMIVGANYE